MIQILFGTVLILSALYYLSEFFKQKQILEEISSRLPCAPRSPILGIYFYTPRNPIKIFHHFMEFPRKYGANVVMWGLLNHVIIMVTDPKDVETIMNSKTTKKSFAYDFLEPWLGQGLLTSYGQKWFIRRKILTPSFHFSILEPFIQIFNKHNVKLVENLKQHQITTSCNELNIYEFLTACALDNMCETAMEFLYNLSPEGFRQRKLLKTLHGFTNKVIQQKIDQKTENHSTSNQIENQKFTFLDILLQATVDGKPLTKSDIREEVDTFMFEGHDTTTSCLNFTIFHLAENPDVQEKVFDELKSIMGENPSNQPNYQQLQEMKYLEMVIKESLRLHPPVSSIGRKTLEPIQIQGVTIPADIDLNIPIYAMHRNPEIFEDPDKFDPDRFLTFEQQNRNPYVYLPFSAGHRNCIGQKFAMLELKSILSTLVRNFRIISTEKTKRNEYCIDIILRPIGGLYVELQRR
uniref:CSON002673 protein n=1 Tax=Culicoides sonorensis TaxID=179676 RepID=A0A336LW23_CULSO